MNKSTTLTIATLLLANFAHADDILIKKGEKLFKKNCKVCHTANIGGKKKAGPNLWNTYENSIASKEGFKYSKAFLALKDKKVINDEFLEEFLTNPRKTVKGTKMTKKIRKPNQRKALIAYLKTLKD